MCGGPSKTQEDLQQEQADFYKEQINAYHESYSQFTEISDALKKQFAPVLAAGPDQQGYSADELSALTTMATEGTAAEYAKAQRAIQQKRAAMGGGTSNVNITSGGAQDEAARVASMAAGQTAAQKLQIKQAGYEYGHQKWQEAVSGEQGLAAGWNPNTFSGSTVNAGKAASDMANTISQQQQSAWGSVLGAIGGIAGQAAGGWALGKAKNA